MTATSDSDEPAFPSGDGGLVRLRLDIGYDGTDFSGWARQPGRRTVQETLEAALATVLRLDGPPSLTVAGRTDAGVHATGQVAHVDLSPVVDPDEVRRRLAGVLPADLAVHRVGPAPAGFDARFAAAGRRYRYRVTDGTPDPLRRRDTLVWKRPLDEAAMHRAAQGLVGEHDFAAYCRPREGSTTVRTLRALDVTRDPDRVVVVTAHADAFCHNQVRAMVGALLAVGDGRRPVGWPAEVLRARVRDSAVNVAPPQGLTLVAVDYPPADEMSAQVERTRRRRGEPWRTLEA
ncbi:MAG TPA: tRNA pseudouridine(38-40) synthase TruA [Mycobacteriales bacterium]|nr:tRNA pseudouridine(38-40) synthase TruA [Mycobacteriales bacterium]